MMPEPRTTAEIVADLRSLADDMDRAEWDDCVGDGQHADSETVREAADRLERPRFTASQIGAAAIAINVNTPCDCGPFVTNLAARAALSAIGTVEDA
jgi:hypothetical protein